MTSTDAPDLRRTAAAATASEANPSSQLMDFGETQFPQYFPGHQSNRIAGTLAYRFYPSTGAYLAVDAGNQIFVLGGPFGNQILYVGKVSDFISSPVQTQDITASQLAKCPEGISIFGSSFYQCMPGRLAGTQSFDTSKPCTLTISSSGTLTLESAGTSFSIMTPYAYSSYTKVLQSGMLTVFAYSEFDGPNVSFISIKNNAAPSATPASFFSAGGKIDASYQGGGGKSLSCMLTLPP